MVVMSLFPAGVLQLLDVMKSSYWHARSLAYTSTGLARLLEWCRMPGDVVFIIFGAAPIVIAAVRAYIAGRSQCRGPCLDSRQVNFRDVSGD